ncbi:hypothetical protein BD769DRAFT_1490158 [Suillus cothurnatus]|nr:hypothetical protein BD769DRAFT_1490158 [Suillus cothurnatus]
MSLYRLYFSRLSRHWLAFLLSQMRYDRARACNHIWRSWPASKHLSIFSFSVISCRQVLHNFRFRYPLFVIHVSNQAQSVSVLRSDCLSWHLPGSYLNLVTFWSSVIPTFVSVDCSSYAPFTIFIY